MARHLLCGCILALLAGPAYAQARPDTSTPKQDLTDKSLEELMKIDVASVTGAAKHEQRVTEAPSSVTILTAADIRTFGWRTLGEALRSVRGFYATYDRNYSYLGVRGFARPTDYNNRVLFLIDGHRLNDNVYDAAYIGTEAPIDLDLVERIEVIRGPGSSLYGSSAFFGVVNIITRRGGAIGGSRGRCRREPRSPTVRGRRQGGPRRTIATSWSQPRATRARASKICSIRNSTTRRRTLAGP